MVAANDASREEGVALLFYSRVDDSRGWGEALRALDPDIDFRVWPDVGDPAEIDAALVWKPEPGLLERFPNLKLIQSLGAGVDHIVGVPGMPRDVPIARLVDPTLTGQMVEYVLLAVLLRQRQWDVYAAQQRERRWHILPAWEAGRCRVGVMGLGEIGGAAARALVDRGYAVSGWSRSPRTIEGMRTFGGEEGLRPFLAELDILVCLLPLTEETRGIINKKTLDALPRGAYLINAARGGHVVDEDLLSALGTGQVCGACLDVFNEEPLPPDHPYWTHPAVVMTPHVAGLTLPHGSMPQVIENLRRVRAGESPMNRVDLERGY